jgi:hypothetical protein
MTECCGNCRFYVGRSCRRYPPVNRLGSTDACSPYQLFFAPEDRDRILPDEETAWPQVKLTDWCGEWASDD